MFSLVRKAPTGLPRDPAPSRWGYRYQRLMLTPVFRAALRVGVPAFLLVFIGGIWFSNETNRTRLAEGLADLRESFESRPEFMVTGIEIEGADIALAAAIADVVNVTFPLSSFDLDLDAIKASVNELTAVKSSTVRVRPGGTLQITVEERRPVVVWRYQDGLRLVDAEGVMTGMIESRADRADLPLIAGDGARSATTEALALIDAAQPLAERFRGLVRMGERRWDLILDRDQRILLPEQDPVAALERVIALDEAQDLLARDILAVDIRNPQRITVRAGLMAADSIRAGGIGQ